MNEFDAFYRRNLRLVYAMARVWQREPCLAEDLTQETFLRAWRHFSLLATMEAPAQRAWLLQVLRNLVSDAWRRSRSALPEMYELSELKADLVERTDLRLDVAQALSKLEAIDREIVVLRYFMQMNSREIGELLQIPESTVRRRLIGCRKHLAERLLQWNPSGDSA